ncbi:hypothetical protein XELAEV_18034127mg [Xenopus laevis]|uniref:Uncharacterized protein n=1 Tax=Xenopus laevis TaxID=8355 RepID=A0A974HEL5_XENLA|nr:hypothetical protein XELAEV_18034127mg [Xenopus laevis]
MGLYGRFYLKLLCPLLTTLCHWVLRFWYQWAGISLGIPQILFFNLLFLFLFLAFFFGFCFGGFGHFMALVCPFFLFLFCHFLGFCLCGFRGRRQICPSLYLSAPLPNLWCFPDILFLPPSPSHLLTCGL